MSPFASPAARTLALAGVLLLTACGSSDDESAPTDDGPPLGTVEEFAQIGGGNEDLAFAADADGSDALFVSQLNRGVVHVDAEGTVTPFADVPKPVGVAALPGGGLLVCGKAASDSEESVIWKVSPSGDATVLISGDSEPFGLTNYVAVAPDGSLAFSDSMNDRLYRANADGTGVQLISDAITYPNGLAFSPSGDTLYVASWDTEQLYAVPRDTGSGDYGAPAVHADGQQNVDGIVAQPSGDLLLVTTGDGVVRLRADGSREVIADGTAFGVSANGAFGVGAFGERWLYVTNLFGSTVSRVRLDSGGVPLPQ